MLTSAQRFMQRQYPGVKAQRVGLGSRTDGPGVGGAVRWATMIELKGQRIGEGETDGEAWRDAYDWHRRTTRTDGGLS